MSRESWMMPLACDEAPEAFCQEIDIPGILREVFGDRTRDAADEMMISALEILAEELPDEMIAQCDRAALRALDRAPFEKLWGSSMTLLVGLCRHATLEGIRLETN